MGTVFGLARLQIRRGWRSLVPIAVLVAAVSAIVLWSAAAARRTDTAFERMLEATDAYHVLVNPDFGSATGLTTEDLLAIDGVEDASRAEFVAVLPAGARTLDAMWEFPGSVMASDGGTGWRLARPIMVEGRFPEPDRAGELFVDVELATLLGVHAGDSVPLQVLSAAGGERLMQLEEMAYSTDADIVEVDRAIGEALDDPALAPLVEFEVTGIGRLPDLVTVDSGFEMPLAIATPALYEQLGEPAVFFGAWHVRLDDPGAVDEFRDAVDDLVPDELVVYQTMSSVQIKAERATSTPAGVLAIFAIAVLGLGVLLIAQGVQRWLGSQSQRMQIVRSLGAGRRELWGAAVVQVAVASLVGFIAGAGVAIAASPLSPVGPARLVETDRGFQVDGFVFGLGAAGLVAVVAAVSVPVWISTGRLDRRTSPGRRNVVTRWVDTSGLPLPVTTGVHFALDPVSGRRGSSRLSIMGALTGIVVAVAALVFTASIDHVTSTPRLYGTSWSAVVSFEGPEPDPSEAAGLIGDVAATVAADPGVRRASAIHAGELTFDGRRVPVVAFRDTGAPLERTVVDGRSPVGPDEVALGRTTLEQLDVSIGDTVILGTPEDSFVATVVGRVVLPAVGSYSGADKTAMGDGAIVDPSLLPPLASFVAIGVELEPGADVAALQAHLDDRYAEFVPQVERYGEPAEVESLQALAAFPRWLALALVLLLGIPVVHSLLVSVRGRRHDLAVLSAVGATPRMLRWTSVVQGITVVLSGVVVGIPVGIVVGRWTWSGLATSFGTLFEPIVPAGAVIGVGAAALAVGALVGGAPLWRTKRGELLRALRPE